MSLPILRPSNNSAFAVFSFFCQTVHTIVYHVQFDAICNWLDQRFLGPLPACPGKWSYTACMCVQVKTGIFDIT